MAEFPALPLWTDAYLGDTTHLTTIEHGAYLLLLMAAWRMEGTRLPDDDKKLARYARLGPQQWARIKDTIADFFLIENGWWTQRRLTDEAYAVRQKREAQAANGRASALKRKGRHAAKRVDPLQPNDQPTGSHSATPTPTPSSVPKGTGADAPPLNLARQLFDDGVAFLALSGRSNDQARKLIGKWRRANGDAQTLAAIVAARDAAGGVSEPVAWIEARLRKIAEPEDEARAISHATAERYRRLGLVETGAERSQGEVAAR